MTASPANLTQEEKNWAMACHLSTLIGFFVPLGSIIAPLIVWLMKRETSNFIEYHGKEALNFQIFMTICFAVAFVLAFALIGFLIIPMLALVDLILTVVVAIKASEGQYYPYPFSLRLVK